MTVTIQITAISKVDADLLILEGAEITRIASELVPTWGLEYKVSDDRVSQALKQLRAAVPDAVYTVRYPGPDIVEETKSRLPLIIGIIVGVGILGLVLTNILS